MIATNYILRAAMAALASFLYAIGGSASADVYWIEQRTTNPTMKASANGGTPTTVTQNGLTVPSSLVFFENSIYWLDVNGPASTQGFVKRAMLDGSNQTTLHSYANPSSGELVAPVGLSMAGSKMFWADPELGAIYRANLDGSVATPVVSSGLALPRTTAADAQYVYWANHDGGTIERAGHDGAGRAVLASSGSFGDALQGIDHMALSTDGLLYWIRGGYGQIYRSSLTSFNPQLLFSLDSQPVETTPDFVLAEGKIYWVNVAAGRIETVNMDGTGRATFYQFTGANPREGPALVAATTVPESRTWLLAGVMTAVLVVGATGKSLASSRGKRVHVGV